MGRSAVSSINTKNSSTSIKAALTGQQRARAFLRQVQHLGSARRLLGSDIGHALSYQTCHRCALLGNADSPIQRWRVPKSCRQ
jgi:hypothetical protein